MKHFLEMVCGHSDSDVYHFNQYIGCVASEYWRGAPYIINHVRIFLTMYLSIITSYFAHLSHPYYRF